MSDIIFSNNASALLNTSITDTDLTIELAAGFGAGFPSPSGSQFFVATLEDDQGNFEIVHCTSRTGDLLTVVRGQDNTTAQSFTQNVTRVELRLTAEVLESLVQVTGATMTGDLNMAGNNIVDALISGGGTQILGGEIVGVPLRGQAGVSSNEVVVPTGGARATAGGSEILVSGDDIVAQLATAGVIVLDSATVGVRVPSGGYVRVEGSTILDYIELIHDDTDANFIFAGAQDLNILSLTGDVVLGAGIDLNAAENQILAAELVDFRLTSQTVSASTTTNIDYEAGSYVTLDMDQSITTLNITNVPTQFATVRLKVEQDGTGGRTITNWPGTDLWPNGTPPTLSTGANAVDFVDLWTDDGGSTWYGSFGNDWS